MLSKAKGQVLRVSVALHALFCDASEDDFVVDIRGSDDEENAEVDSHSDDGQSDEEVGVTARHNKAAGSNDSYEDKEDVIIKDPPKVSSKVPLIISKRAIVAAENFVDVCNQHTAFIAGRGQLASEIEEISQLKPPPVGKLFVLAIENC